MKGVPRCNNYERRSLCVITTELSNDTSLATKAQTNVRILAMKSLTPLFRRRVCELW